MKKIDIILSLGNKLRKEDASLSELEILLYIHRGINTQEQIESQINACSATVSRVINKLLRHEEIMCSMLKRGKTPAQYALSEGGLRLIERLIPSDSKP